MTSSLKLVARCGRQVLTLAVLLGALVLAGCSNSTSNTARYGGPSVASVTAKRIAARSDVREAKKDVRAAKRDIRSLERTIKRAERKLKRKRTKKAAKKDLKKDLRKTKRELRKAKRTLRRAERKLDRAERDEKRAQQAIVAAKKRKVDAERKLAAERKRKKAEEKARKQELARAEISRKKKDEKPVTTSLASLFDSSDPALANVRDYEARVDNDFALAAIPVQQINKRFLRQEVRYSSREKVGTIIVDPHNKFLYLTMPGGRAMRYGIGVGKAGFEWSGSAHIGWKQKWPKWTPPTEMIERRPDLEKWSAANGGMPGGTSNPLGARALYLMQGNVDTLYRLHGTPNWGSIGTAASSGCIRLMNQDVIDLYDRARTGAKVVVLS